VLHLKHIVEQTLIPHSAFQDSIERVNQCLDLIDGTSEPICIAIVGESRTGKTRVVRTIVRQHPPERRADGLKIPVLRVSVPSKPTVKGFASEILRALGDPCFDKGEEVRLTSRIQDLLNTTETKAIVLEEFQHFQEKTSLKVWEHVTDWLKVLVDNSRVALVVAGLPTCLDVIYQNEQLAGRFLAPIKLPRFDWTINQSRDEFLGITAAFGDALSLHFDLPDLGQEEMGFRLYCASGGVIGYLTKLLKQAVWDAINRNSKSIRLSDFNEAYLRSIASEDEAASRARPFTSRFSTSADPEIIAAAKKVGLRRIGPILPVVQMEPTEPSRAKPRGRLPKSPVSPPRPSQDGPDL
jgi:hypothetical protein